ncbi:MAG: serine--tRNA ligase [Bacillota bacterium]
MHDMKRIAKDPGAFAAAMRSRNEEIDVGALLEQESKRKELLQQAEELKAKRNAVSQEVPRLMKAGRREEAEALKDGMKQVSDSIKALDDALRVHDEAVRELLLRIPNVPHESVPIGPDESANVEVRKVGPPRAFGFEPQPHWDIGEKLGILDFAAGAKVTGARFTFYKGAGARLERALINFMLDTHAKAGYEEVFPPFIVHRSSMVGTGQLPKFEMDAFKLQGSDYFLVPTAEVPVTNLYRDSIIERELPIKNAAYSACFRAEAGSAGRDTRGLIRQHQFNKVELVKIAHPDTSYDELETLTQDAERILQLLELPYRVVALSTGDLGFASAKTYDLEVWMPSYGRYLEISSCSNFEDFQARRAGIRFRPSPREKARYVHTLNGSGLAIGRTVAAILENCQNEDGSVTVPEALVPYMGISRID